MILRNLLPIFSSSLLLLLPGIATAQRAIPATLQPCIRQLNTKSTPVASVFTRGTYQEGKKTHYLLILSPPQVYGPTDAVLSSSPSGCQVLTRYPSGMPIPVTAAVPLSVARGLTLNILKSDISKAGGLQKYQASLNIAAQDTGRLYLGANDVWALHQVGIHIPPGTKIISPSPR